MKGPEIQPPTIPGRRGETLAADAAPAVSPRRRGTGGPRHVARAALGPLREELRWTGTGILPRPRKRGAGDLKSPPVERREAPAFRKERGFTNTDAPIGAPLPRACPEGKKCPARAGDGRRRTPRRKEQGR